MGTIEMLRDISDPEWQKAHMDMGFYSPIGELYKELGIIPKTNADRIRSSSDEELAKFFLDCVACDDCPVGESKCKGEWAKCTDAALSWLKSPAEEGEQDG